MLVDGLVAARLNAASSPPSPVVVSPSGVVPSSVVAMRAVNSEWDFMSRTYTVLALGDLALDAAGEDR